MAFPAEALHPNTPQVLQTAEQSPLTHEVPKYLTLRFYPNGLIDLEPLNGKPPDNSHLNGLEYEEHGMTIVDTMIPEGHFAIGAHLLDAATIRTDLERGGNGRPDMMEFDFNGRLTRMFEFKRIVIGSYYEKLLQRKMIGISSLLRKLRANPLRLGQLIGNVTGQEILPNPVIIPPDHELEPVIFISSVDHGNEIITAEGTDLRGLFMTIPLPLKPS